MTGGSGPTAVGPSATPWPVLAAVGLAVGELGVLAGSVPVATAGVVLLGGGLSGILADAGYVGTLARSMVPIGALFLLVGAGIWAGRSPSFAVSALAATVTADGIARRGLALVVAGGLLVGLGYVVGRRSAVER